MVVLDCVLVKLFLCILLFVSYACHSWLIGYVTYQFHHFGTHHFGAGTNWGTIRRRCFGAGRFGTTTLPDSSMCSFVTFFVGVTLFS